MSSDGWKTVAVVSSSVLSSAVSIVLIGSVWWVGSEVEHAAEHIKRSVAALDSRVAELEGRLPSIQDSGNPTLSTDHSGHTTITVGDSKDEPNAEEYRDPAEYPQLQTSQIAAVERVSSSAILKRMRQEGGATFYVDEAGRKWRAHKVGKRWLIDNPYGPESSGEVREFP